MRFAQELMAFGSVRMIMFMTESALQLTHENERHSG